MLAIELVKPGTASTTKEPNPEAVSAIAAYAAQHGLLVLTAGTWGNVLRFLPSLAVSDALIADAVVGARRRLRRPVSPAVFTGEQAVELAVVERSGFVESRHLGSAVVLGPDGTVVRSLGDPAAPVFPRSSMKPFQAIAVMGAGVPLDGAAAVLATASHAGTPAHLSVVRGLLAQAQLTEDALQCPDDWPLDTAARDEAIRAGRSKQALFMNCSGKHAAMLARLPAQRVAVRLLPRAAASASAAHPGRGRAAHRRQGRGHRHRRMRGAGARDGADDARPGNPAHRHRLAGLAVRALPQRRSAQERGARRTAGPSTGPDARTRSSSTTSESSPSSAQRA